MGIKTKITPSWSGSVIKAGEAESDNDNSISLPFICEAMSNRYLALKPISIESDVYFTSNSSVAFPRSWLLNYYLKIVLLL